MIQLALYLAATMFVGWVLFAFGLPIIGWVWFRSFGFARTLRWKPRVNDVVLHNTMAGWVKKRVSNIYADGEVRLTNDHWSPGCHGSSSWKPSAIGMIYTGKNLDRKVLERSGP